MNRLALALLSLGLVGSAQAQTNFNMPPPGGVMVIGVQVVATCGVGTLSTTTPGFVTMNQLGQLCTNASGGGGSVTQGTVPWVDSVTLWGGGTLGAMANYGTSPGAVLVPGVNAFVTNATAPGQAAMAASSPVVFPSDQAGTCTLHGFKHITSATDTLAVQGVTAQTIRLCAWRSRAAGTATWYWENTNNTNANCGGTLAQISGVATEAVNTGEVVSLPLGITLNNTSGNGLCINSTGTGGVDIDYWYAQR